MKISFVRKSLGLLCLFGLCGMLSTPATAQTASGTWKWNFTRPDGEKIDFSLDLVQDGQQLTGTYHSPWGGDTAIEKGRISNDQVSFTITRERDGTSFTVNYQGALQDNDITGKITMGGGDREFDWIAQREAPPAEATGVWKWSSTGRNGEVRESQITLKQAGTKLSGTIQTGRGESPIEAGRIQGDALSFEITRETDRGRFNTTYQGKISGDTIQGSVQRTFGDQTFDREWTAKRGSVDPTGTWAWSMTGENGQDWESDLELKLDGNAVTGAFHREDGDWRMEIENGKIAGNILTFETAFEREGTRVVIKNTATLTGSSMQGQSKGERDGEPWTREWQATKK